MLDEKGFDLWAGGYDREVGITEEENAYPFAGYRDVLGGIFQAVMQKPNAVVLDLGFGTGTLTAKLYENGCAVFGQDFSAEMIALTSAKMPRARLYRDDFTKGLAKPLTDRRYDFIVATYALHHLTDGEKLPFIQTLLGLLKEDGRILIGDVAFETREDLEQCRREAGEEWDDEEDYFVAEEMKRAFPRLSFERISYCAGIISITR